MPRPPSPRPLLPTVVTVAMGILVTVSAFLPWYSPDIAPPLTPDSVSGWDATFAAKLMVVGAVVATIAAAVLLLDALGRMRLDAVGAAALAIVCVVGIAVAAGMVGFRAIRIPEPADLLSRQIGLYLALAAGVLGMVAALVQLLFTLSPDDEPRRARGKRRRRR